MTKEQLLELLNDMTLDEKIGQMVQLTAGFLGEKEINITGPMGSVKVSKEETKLCGSILNTFGANWLMRIQDQVMADQPHHIPMLFMRDVINGHETIFPIPLAQSCSFDTELARRGAEIAAKESAVSGLHVTFAPMLDLVRDARWGRVMESPGEDPYLNYCMAKAWVQGFQGNDVKENGRISGCLKHFAGYGYPEGGREYDNVELSERTFRQDYLSGYQGAVDVGCKMAMTSFNTLNRIPSSGNRWLMRDVLRRDMGFDGVLISDYAAIEELIPHGIAENKREAAKLAIEAGVDIDMMSDVYLHHLKEAVEAGEVDEKLVDESVLRILTLKNDLGLFENPYKDANIEEESKFLFCDEHRKEARDAATKTFVLLKNEEQILPLNNKEETGTILFAGPYIDERQICGAWSFPSNYNRIPTIQERILEKNIKANIEFSKGCSIVSKGTMAKECLIPNMMTQEEIEVLTQKAVEDAKKASVVVLCLGEYYNQTGEGASRTELTIPEIQMELLRKVSAVNPNVVTILFSGRPLEVVEIETLSKAVMMVWMPGTEGAGAIADVLFGDKEPEGRLSMSLPYTIAQEPLYYNRFMSGRPRFKSTDSKCFRTGYMDLDYFPYHAFGYGLSYTKFEYSPVVLEKDTMRKDESIFAKVIVKNVGNRKGTETVQMYLRDITGSVVRPIRELKGFEKVTLEVGEEKEVCFEITEEMLRFWRMDMTFGSENGWFEVYIGNESMTGNKAKFMLK